MFSVNCSLQANRYEAGTLQKMRVRTVEGETQIPVQRPEKHAVASVLRKERIKLGKATVDIAVV